MIAVYYLLYGDTFLLGTDGYWYTMLVATADENNVLLLETEIANIDIGWHVNTCQVTDMNTTVGIANIFLLFGCKITKKCWKFGIFSALFLFYYIIRCKMKG